MEEEKNECHNKNEEENNQVNEKVIDINAPQELFQNIDFEDIISKLKDHNLVNCEENNININIENNEKYSEFDDINGKELNIKDTLNLNELNMNDENNDYNYNNMFNTNNNSEDKKLDRKRASLNFELLKDDSSLLKKSVILEKEEFLKVEDWEYIEKIEEAEENFKFIENQIIKADLYNLYETIKKTNIYNINTDNSNFPTIGPVSTLEYMVESTFGFDKYMVGHITEHILSLDNYIFRWRSILGDGNCFYRGVMFAFLENIVFERNIMLLKNIMNEVNKFFDVNYQNTSDLPASTREEIIKTKKILILKILYLIYDLLDSDNSQDGINRAYEVLIKCFLFCKSFDIGMVLYYRYKIYEFIKLNSNKVYTKQFSVKIGNLLPSEYETINGGKKLFKINLDFLFDKFISDNLLKLDVDAEKIVIYLTPFVLKINLKIIIYEFDKDSNVLIKDFQSYLDNKPDITLLYRKTHYDIVYDSKYFEKNSKQLCYYVNLDENLKVVDARMLSSLKYRSGFSDNYNSSAFEYNNSYGGNQNNLQINHEDKIDKMKCLSCEKNLNKSNILNVCKECMSNELVSQVMGNYMIFLNESIALYQSNQEKNIPSLFNHLFNQNQIIFHEKPLTISKLATIAETNLGQVIKEVKSKLCLMCSQDLESNKYGDLKLQLPCGCNICSKNCFNTFFFLIFNKKKNNNTTICICGYTYNNNDFKSIYEFLDKSKLKDHKKVIETIVTQNMLYTCSGGCMDQVYQSTKEFNLLKFKDPELTKLFKKKEFRHVVCTDCLENRRIREKDNFDCVLCNSFHRIEKIKKNYSDGEDECSIL